MPLDYLLADVDDPAIRRIFHDDLPQASRTERESLKAGDRVKLLFAYRDGDAWVECDSFWAEVVRAWSCTYVGHVVLVSMPLIGEFTPGDEVVFGPENVIRIG